MTDMADIEKIVSYDGEDRIVHFFEYLAEKDKKPKKNSFPTGFHVFDKKLGPIEPGRVVVISGYAKNGKTLFTESLIKGMMDASEFLNAVFFSFEIEPEKMMSKYLLDPKRGVFLPRQLKTMNFEWLLERCKEAKFKHGCSAVLLDHLHFLVDMNTKQNMSLNIGAFMRRLKFEIAMELQMVVFLNAHQEKGKEGEEASMRGARDSSFIGQECDAFVVVTRKKNYTEKEFEEISRKRGAHEAVRLKSILNSNSREVGWEDDYSQGLAIVKVDCSRMSGAFEAKTLFCKDGDFLVEV